jgi:hypothetical protein
MRSLLAFAAGLAVAATASPVLDETLPALDMVSGRRGPPGRLRNSHSKILTRFPRPRRLPRAPSACPSIAAQSIIEAVNSNPASTWTAGINTKFSDMTIVRKSGCVRG